MSGCAYAHGLLDEEEKPPMNKVLGKWYLPAALFATVVLAVAFCSIGATQGPSNLPVNVDERLIFLQELQNVSLACQVHQPVLAGAGAAPEVLIEDDEEFSRLMTSESVNFDDIETGVSTMASFVAHYRTMAISPAQKTFWAPLQDPNRVHHIFRKEHEVLHSVIPTDLNIVEAVSILGTIADYGIEVEPNMHVAYSLNLMNFMAVTTSPVDGALSNAYAVRDPTSLGIPIDRAVGLACAKAYVEEIGLGYGCGVKLFSISVEP
eukprot:Skav201665  [mRNA]  locus=scaffold641:299714:300505:+ [translate_table: standard]